ncbi:hypothetical protein PUN28_000108 [Cardiocondyla obscurior]|uniref:Secreted protein n=1 Tax=Cardiocondyla obscurior TaxID=286306 RepID=A0AAW2GXT6_9HYME
MRNVRIVALVPPSRILCCRCNVGNCGRLAPARDDGPSYVSYDWQRKASSQPGAVLVRGIMRVVRGSASQILFQILFAGPFPFRVVVKYDAKLRRGERLTRLKRSSVFTSTIRDTHCVITSAKSIAMNLNHKTAKVCTTRPIVRLYYEISSIKKKKK